MNTINVTVLGEPKAQKRHRHAKRGNFIATYDPQKADKQDFLSIVQKNAPLEPLDRPLKVEINFFFSRPTNHYGTGKNAGVLKPTAPTFHTVKPDTDNLAKFILDAMNKVYWIDDSRICNLVVTKKYDNKPRTDITVSAAEDEEIW